MFQYQNIKVVKMFNRDLFVIAMLFIIFAVCKANIITMPYHWDELGAYISPAHWLAGGNLLRSLPGLHPPDVFYGHPFASYLTLAALYKIFGESVHVSHVFILLVSFLGVMYTYQLGKLLHNESVGVISALLLFLCPIYFAQSGMVNGDVIITTLGVSTIYYFLKRNCTLYLISGILLVLTKETSAAIVVSILIYLCIESNKNKDLLKTFSMYSVPLLVLLIFFIMQKIFTGVFLPNQYFATHNFFELSALDILGKMRRVFSSVFVTQNRFVLSLILCANLIAYKKHAFKKEHLLFFIISMFFIGAFTGIYFLNRYVLPVLPYLCIVGASSIVMLFNYKKTYIPIAMIVMLSFVFELHGHDAYGDSHENDMQYTDVVLLHKDACSYVEKNFPDKKVLAAWPMVSEFENPYLGFVHKPIIVTDKIDDGADIVVYTEQSSNDKSMEIQNYLERMVQSKKIRLLQVFTRNSKMVGIYSM
jgi:4-amino-4-deoxy-L-arabinose transferase-like glycosyltransferase